MILSSSSTYIQLSLEDIPAAFWSHILDWRYDNHILTYKGHVYVPSDDSLHHDILSQCHDHKTTSHPRYLKTRQLVTTEFWWPGLAQYVWRYVEGCAAHQQNKSNTHPTVPLFTLIKSHTLHPFQQVSCDLIINLPTSSGFNSLLVVVDNGLTKGVILCPTKKSITAEGIAVLFSTKSAFALTHTTKSSLIMACNSSLLLLRSLASSSTMIFHSPPLITPNPMVKQNVSTRRLKCTFRSFVETT